jgi:hypothetical protein
LSSDDQDALKTWIAEHPELDARARKDLEEWLDTDKRERR